MSHGHETRTLRTTTRTYESLGLQEVLSFELARELRDGHHISVNQPSRRGHHGDIDHRVDASERAR
jgi:hypothetical protein